MIDIISDWASSLVVSLIIVTILEMLLPDNKIKKYVKTVIGIYIIFCLISPFINEREVETILKNTEKNLEKIEMQSQVASMQNEQNSIEVLYIQEFEKDVINRVEQLGYKVKKCDVDIEIDATKENAGIHAIYLTIGDESVKSNNIEIESIEKVEIGINNSESGNNSQETVDNEITRKIKKNLSDYYEISEDRIKIKQN